MTTGHWEWWGKRWTAKIFTKWIQRVIFGVFVTWMVNTRKEINLSLILISIKGRISSDCSWTLTKESWDSSTRSETEVCAPTRVDFQRKCFHISVLEMHTLHLMFSRQINKNGKLHLTFLILHIVFFARDKIIIKINAVHAVWLECAHNYWGHCVSIYMAMWLLNHPMFKYLGWCINTKTIFFYVIINVKSNKYYLVYLCDIIQVKYSVVMSPLPADWSRVVCSTSSGGVGVRMEFLLIVLWRMTHTCNTCSGETHRLWRQLNELSETCLPEGVCRHISFIFSKACRYFVLLIYPMTVRNLLKH